MLLSIGQSFTFENRYIEHAFAEGTPIDQAIEEGIQRALIRHKRAGNPIVVWQDGQIL